MVQCTNTYKHIHTYKQTPLAFNMLMWGSLRLVPKIVFLLYSSGVLLDLLVQFNYMPQFTSWIF